MNISKALFAILTMASTLLLAACSDGGSSQVGADHQNRTSYNPADFVLTQSSALPTYGSSQVMVELKNLPSDDPVYIAINSHEQENGLLTVKPYRTIINPNEGSAVFSVTLTDAGVTAQPDLNVTITSSGNTVIQQSLSIELAK